jgi:hypothetical protein
LYVSLLENDRDFWSFGHDQVVVRILESVFILILKVPCEVGYHGGYDKFAHRLDKSLPDANSLATKEWRKAKWVSLFTFWSKVVRAIRVEAFWDEFLWL